MDLICESFQRNLKCLCRLKHRVGFKNIFHMVNNVIRFSPHRDKATSNDNF